MTPAAQGGKALLLVAHGERREGTRNRTLMEHAEALARRDGLGAVAYGVLKGEPSLEEGLARLASERPSTLVVYPFLMSSGHFVTRILPSRIAAAGYAGAIAVTAPLGLDPGLAAIARRMAIVRAAAAGFAPERTTLLVVGHGSKLGNASADATEALARALARTTSFKSVSTAFIEQAPFVTPALAACASPVVVLGFFSGEGMHAWIDVPAAIEETGADAVYTGPVGADPDVRGLILASVRAEPGTA